MTRTAKSSGEITVLELSGSPRDIGVAHGEILRDRISEVIRRWRANLEESSGLAAHSFLERFGQDTNFMPAVKRATPNLLHEIEGLAEGSGVPFSDLFAFQLIDEQWIYTRQLREQSVASPHHCTALGVFDAGQPPILAQNMDIADDLL